MSKMRHLERPPADIRPATVISSPKLRLKGIRNAPPSLGTRAEQLEPRSLLETVERREA